ncbi:hypothetical protein JNUCC1_02744 [Lentibacillus sp. JNUCC-1]|uniref:AbrB/MazE/SpoVT family DNA-binding domain-containing protein n=1 Tax=Lentibacillus sp. JNUCC-1 TaxID=2654513 RepID=UPI0012E90E2A|nr:AbrB/MazE/SpoVT family DNA-binding domain-containing protein [Lentibacillus sp. JNUCC-1]MUV38873.1 hypothetical protein [Lentibacillus sp. JNUCC-1]
MEAKLTSKGQITIPKEIRHLLNLKSGDVLSFDIREDGVMMNKSSRPLTIQERFANYTFNKSNGVDEFMQEVETGDDVGEER